MKNRLTILLIFLSAIYSCSLDEKMLSNPRPEDYFQNEPQCLSALNACYPPFRVIYNNINYLMICETQTDIMYSTKLGHVNSILQVSPSSPAFGSTMWQQGYLGVMRANAAYAGISRSPLSEEQKVPLIAEAVVLRALYYYVLTSNFGNVPYYTEEVTSANNMDISRIPRMSAHDIRNALIDELYLWLVEKKALDFKRTNDETNKQQYRFGAAVGLFLAGKMCLWEERWTEAIEFFGYLEDIYAPGVEDPSLLLAKYPLADIPFNVRNAPEVILEISQTFTDYGLRLQGSLASYMQPIRSDTEPEEDIDDSEIIEEPDNDLYNGICIPELGKYSRTHVPIRPTKRFYKELMPWDSPDRRRASYEITVTSSSEAGEVVEISDGGGYLAWGWPGYALEDDRSTTDPKFRLFTSVSKPTGRPFCGNKFWCFGMRMSYDTNSYKVFRFAGAVLGLAEAWFRAGDYKKACAYLNAVKGRAGLLPVSPSDFRDPDDLLEEIQDECARELFGEYQRKHDLVRWGIWYDMVMKYNADKTTGENNTRLRSNIKRCHEYYPIPAEQITYSGGALDNDEYNRYGL